MEGDAPPAQRRPLQGAGTSWWSWRRDGAPVESSSPHPTQRSDGGQEPPRLPAGQEDRGGHEESEELVTTAAGTRQAAPNAPSPAADNAKEAVSPPEPDADPTASEAVAQPSGGKRDQPPQQQQQQQQAGGSSWWGWARGAPAASAADGDVQPSRRPDRSDRGGTGEEQSGWLAGGASLLSSLLSGGSKARESKGKEPANTAPLLEGSQQRMDEEWQEFDPDESSPFASQQSGCRASGLGPRRLSTQAGPSWARNTSRQPSATMHQAAVTSVQRAGSISGVQFGSGVSVASINQEAHTRTSSFSWVAEDPEGIHMDSWRPVFENDAVSLPAFLLETKRSPEHKGWGWLGSAVTHAGNNRKEAAPDGGSRWSSRAPEMLETDSMASQALFLADGKLLGNHQYASVPALPTIQSGGVPEIVQSAQQDLNIIYVMRPLRLVMWLGLFLAGYVAQIGWCSLGLPSECKAVDAAAHDKGAVILNDLVRMAQLGFTTGWFARITHPRRFAWLIAKENLWFYLLYFLLMPIIGLTANLKGFEHRVDEWRSWSALQIIAVTSMTAIGASSIVWHTLQAFKRSVLVGSVFMLVRVAILTVYLCEVAVNQTDSSPSGPKHIHPYFLIWWTSLFSEYNHVISDATLAIGVAFLVQGIAVHSFNYDEAH